MPPREAGGVPWLLAAGGRLQALPWPGAMLAPDRGHAAGGRPRLAVLSADRSGAGLVTEWSGGLVPGRKDASWRLHPEDRFTVAGGLGRPDGCTLFIQGGSPAGVPSVGVLSLDPGSRAFRLEAVARGVVPPVGGTGPAWRLDRGDALYALGRGGRSGAWAMLVQRRARDRSERQRLAVLSYDPGRGALLTDWVAAEELPNRRIGPPGWRPDPLDRFHPLGSGGPGPVRLLAQGRISRDPDRSRIGVLTYGGPGIGLMTERVFQDVLPPRR